MARELARLRGVSLTSAVTEALREKLEREKHGRGGKSLSAELLEIGKRCASHVRRSAKSSDHAVLFYGEKGLPR